MSDDKTSQKLHMTEDVTVMIGKPYRTSIYVKAKPDDQWASKSIEVDCILGDPYPDPDQPQYLMQPVLYEGKEHLLHVAAMRKLADIQDDLKEALGPYLRLCEGISIMPYPPVDRMPDGRIACFMVEGNSEGHYVHVEAIKSGKSECVFLIKTFCGASIALAISNIINLYFQGSPGKDTIAWRLLEDMHDQANEQLFDVLAEDYNKQEENKE